MGAAQTLNAKRAKVAAVLSLPCRRTARLPVGLPALLVCALAGCGLAGCGDDASPAEDAGDPEICDELRDPLAQPGDPIDGDTYQTFAQPFLASYCIRCHDSALTTFEMRGGAPAGYDWDQEDIVRTHLTEIRSAVGVTNFMPFNAPFPSCEERARLVRWIDAAAP